MFLFVHRLLIDGVGYCYRLNYCFNNVGLRVVLVWLDTWQTEGRQPFYGISRARYNFSAFCKQDPVPDLFSCAIYAANWRSEGRELVFEIEGNRFLRHMVRILVGTIVEIGSNKRSPEDLVRLLQDGRREEAGKTAPACGLHLLQVCYGNT